MLGDIYSNYGAEISFGYIYNAGEGMGVMSFKP